MVKPAGVRAISPPTGIWRPSVPRAWFCRPTSVWWSSSAASKSREHAPRPMPTAGAAISNRCAARRWTFPRTNWSWPRISMVRTCTCTATSTTRPSRPTCRGYGTPISALPAIWAMPSSPPNSVVVTDTAVWPWKSPGSTPPSTGWCRKICVTVFSGHGTPTAPIPAACSRTTGPRSGPTSWPSCTPCGM